jgi:hypothetical protein
MARDEVDKNESGINADRRDLMRVATAAGLMGAAGLATAAAAAQRPAAGAPAAGAVEDPKAPAGLGKNAVPDQRFPLTYQAPVSNGTRILMDHLAALSRRDLNGIADTLHFPFASYEGTDLYVARTREEFVAKPPASLNPTMNPKRHSANDGFMKPGSYDVFQGLEVLGTHPVNATISLVYDRYDSQGKKLLRSEGMYAITNNDGRWAIELASTIFTPADMIGTVFDETIRQAKLLRVNHTLSAATGDEAFDRMTVQPGKTAGLSGGASWTAQVKGQEEVMRGYRVKGVTSRLQVRETTGNEPLRGERGTYQEYWDGMGTLGLGPWGFIYGTWKEGRVVHHTADKAHVQASAVRYTAAGEEMSLAVQTMVVVYKGGKWSSPGNLIYATPHDRNNDIHAGGLEPV